MFPALFTAGMGLLDTLDAVMMAGAYRWAAVEPRRKLYYNMAITATSVLVAAGIGGIEVLAGEPPAGGPWKLIAKLNDHPGEIGGAIIALFALAWRARSAPSVERY